MEEVELNRSLERSRLYLSDTPMYLDASSIISSSVHSDNPDFRCSYSWETEGWSRLGEGKQKAEESTIWAKGFGCWTTKETDCSTGRSKGQRRKSCKGIQWAQGRYAEAIREEK